MNMWGFFFFLLFFGCFFLSGSLVVSPFMVVLLVFLVLSWCGIQDSLGYFSSLTFSLCYLVDFIRPFVEGFRWSLVGAIGSLFVVILVVW